MPPQRAAAAAPQFLATRAPAVDFLVRRAPNPCRPGQALRRRLPCRPAPPALMPSRAAGARPSLHRRPPRLPAPPAPVPSRRAAAPSPQSLATRPPPVDSLVRLCSSFLLRRAPAPSTLWSTRRFFVLCCSGELQRRVPLPSTVVPCLRCAASSTHPPSATLSPLRCCISVDFD